MKEVDLERVILMMVQEIPPVHTSVNIAERGRWWAQSSLSQPTSVKMLAESPILEGTEDKHSWEQIRLLAVSHNLRNVFVIQYAISTTFQRLKLTTNKTQSQIQQRDAGSLQTTLVPTLATSWASQIMEGKRHQRPSRLQPSQRTELFCISLCWK